MAKALAQNIATALLVGLFVMTSVAPGLALHHCRHFGTVSTELCGCCEVELESKSCCDQTDHTSVAPSPAANSLSLSSGCCFVSYEGPFSYNASSVTENPTVRPIAKSDLVVATSVAQVTSVSSASTSPLFETDLSRHSADPPAYLLTHSFRC